MWASFVAAMVVMFSIGFEGTGPGPGIGVEVVVEAVRGGRVVDDVGSGGDDDAVAVAGADAKSQIPFAWNVHPAR